MTDVLTDVQTKTSLDDDLAALAQPLRARLERIEKELAAAQTLEAGLRSDRMKVVAALRAVDPTFTTKFAGGKRGAAKNNGVPVASSKRVITDEKVKVIQDWVESLRDELPARGVTGTQLARREDAPAKQEHIAYALRVMHDRGIVRLDHSGTGGSKFYVLV